MARKVKQDKPFKSNCSSCARNVEVPVSNNGGKSTSDISSNSVNPTSVREYGCKLRLKWKERNLLQGFGIGGHVDKVGLVRRLIAFEKPSIIAFQETRLNLVDLSWVQSLWGATNCVHGIWRDSGSKFSVLNIHGPHEDIGKVKLWNDLSTFVNQYNRLIEIPLGGRNFIRVSDDGLKFSKIDRDEERNFGPKPFKCFDAWYKEDGFDKLVTDAWSCTADIHTNRKDVIFTRKLKNVKESLKVWNDSPEEIKDEVFKHFKKRFKEPDIVRPSMEDLCYPTLSVDEASALEWCFDEHEIKEAVFECGSTKAPGPDGFNMRFFKKFWDTIKNDLVDAIVWCLG
ncbi:uncharacterized protein [Rutidosis leptorrhynchoides]|uniref:uncharacterized protein n=1 Tax=Rutidosis leptorrhynchoides TaxID=125765 RepID=UPI003A9997DE